MYLKEPRGFLLGKNMPLKKEKKNKEITLRFRVTEEEANRILKKCMTYEESLSDWCRYAAMHFVPGKEDLSLTKKGKRK